MKEDLTVLKKLAYAAFTLFVALTVLSMVVIMAKAMFGVDDCEVRKEEQIHVKWTIPFKGTFGE